MDRAHPKTIDHKSTPMGHSLRRRDDGRWIYKEYLGSIEATQYRARSLENIERPLHSRFF
jgi:hypothetical protein